MSAPAASPKSVTAFAADTCLLWPRWALVLVAFGVYLTLRGYHSLDGDQAYRLPLMLHMHDPLLYAADPFVRSFDAFNPHQGYLLVLDGLSGLIGLGAALFVIYSCVFILTCYSINTMARAVWPRAGQAAGVVAVALILIAKAGNIGTNHLFEAELLDRLIGFALGWLAFSQVIENPERGRLVAAGAIGLAQWIHPTLGLQLGLVLAISWFAWPLVGGRTAIGFRVAAGGAAMLACALAPGVWQSLAQSHTLFEGLTTSEFRLLSIELQGPQHMLPHLWSSPQWLAWAGYFVLAALALARVGEASILETQDAGTAARARFALMLGIVLIWLGVSWVAVEPLGSVSATVFQPFRMASVARGLALVALSARVFRLASRGDTIGRVRAVVLVVGLGASDWAFVIATAFELAAALGDARWPRSRFAAVPAWTVLGYGFFFLSRHDTASGHGPLLVAVATALVIPWKRVALSFTGRAPSSGRVTRALLISWATPIAALIVGCWITCVAETLQTSHRRTPRWLYAVATHCRFAAIPNDDTERIALWCRSNTPLDAVFLGPPGPKTFRLWSRRALVCNRAASPYHARGLNDWARRYRDIVNFKGTMSELVATYVQSRHQLEHRYLDRSDDDLARLATRQGAGYVIADIGPADQPRGGKASRLERLHFEGEWAVFRVRANRANPPANARPSTSQEPRGRTEG